MYASDMIDIVRNNTRKYEQHFRGEQERLSAAGEQSLRIQHDIVATLGKIAAIQLEGNASLDDDIKRQLQIRRDEEGSISDQLGVVEYLIADSLRDQKTAAEQIRGAEAEIQERLNRDSDYVQLAAHHAVAIANLEGSQGKYDEIRAECESKLAEYGEDHLYSYLRSVSYGGESYRRRGIFRALDQWIAGLCRFHANYPNEQLLRTMLLSNEEAYTGQAEHISDLTGQIDAIRQAVVATSPLAELKKQSEMLNKQQAAYKLRANGIHKELEKYAAKTDARYLRTKEMLASRMQESSIEELLKRVGQTKNPDDDAILNEVVQLRETLAEARAEYTLIQSEHIRAREDFDRAKEVERKLRNQRYSSDSYQYRDSLNLNDLLLGYMAGRLNTVQITDAVQQYQHVRQVHSPSISNDDSGSWGGGSWGGGSDGGSSSSSFGTSDSF